MTKTYKEIKEALPTIESEKVEDYSDALDRTLSLKSLFKSSGGKILIEELRDTCATTLNKLVIAANETPELPLLLSLIQKYSANVKVLMKAQDIKMEDELREQLDKAVEEAMK